MISARVFDTYGEILPNEFNENVENEEEYRTTTWVTIREEILWRQLPTLLIFQYNSLRS
jgi:hypothetical protein